MRIKRSLRGEKNTHIKEKCQHSFLTHWLYTEQTRSNQSKDFKSEGWKQAIGKVGQALVLNPLFSVGSIIWVEIGKEVKDKKQTS